MGDGQGRKYQRSIEGESSAFPSEKEQTEAELREIGLIDGAIGFRDDLGDIFAEVAVRDYGISEKKQLRNTGEQGLRDAGKAYRRLNRGVKIVNKIEIAGILIFGVLTFFAISIPDFGISILYQGGISAFITVVTWLIGTNLIIGSVTTEQIAYQGLTTRLSDERLCFRAKWNKAVLMSPFSFIGVIIVGLIRTRWPNQYEAGLERIQKNLSQKESEGDL